MVPRPLLAALSLALLLALLAAAPGPAAPPEGWISPHGPPAAEGSAPRTPLASGPPRADRLQEWRALAAPAAPTDLGPGDPAFTEADLEAVATIEAFTPTLDLERFLAERSTAAPADGGR